MLDASPTAPHRTWLPWVFASTVGWVAGALVADAFSAGLGLMEAGAAVVGGGALAAGLGQWLVLRREMDHAFAWVVATAVGLAGVAVLVLLVPPLDWGLGAAIGGAVIGLAQWPVLRRRATHAAWWIAVSTVGWIAGGLLSGATTPPTGWLVIGLVYGTLTGTALILLLRTTAPTD